MNSYWHYAIWSCKKKIDLLLLIFINIYKQYYKMTDIIYTIIVLFKNSEECRRNKQRVEYNKIYWEME